MNNKTYENFPAHLILLCNAGSVLTYAIGTYLMGSIGIACAGIYLVYCLWVEARVLTMSCRHCYYFGRTCGFGKGRVCSWLFKKGTPAQFAARDISWKDIVPDFLVFVLPIAGGAILLIKDFSWLVLGLLVALLVLSFAGAALVRGNIACKYCKQREIGCPAERLFSRAGAKR